MLQTLTPRLRLAPRPLGGEAPGIPPAAPRFIPCTIALLPEARRLAAARAAVAVNPANAPAEEMLALGGGEAGLGHAQLALLTTKFWGSGGVRLTVAFLDGPPRELQRRILSHMNAWGEWANVVFALTAGAAQVRIAREAGGYWSNLGTDILGVPAGQPTMNLEGFAMETDDREFFRVVRHETGHTLGFPHEHRRREVVERIDRAKAIAFFEQNQGWDAARTTEQVLTPYADSALRATAAADERSIMCYWLPAEIMKDGVGVPGGADIDLRDARFAAQVYRKPSWPRPVVFATTVDGALWASTRQDGAWSWTEHGTPPGAVLAPGALAAACGEGPAAVFAVSTAGELWGRRWDGGAWRWQAHGAPPGETLAPDALATGSHAGRPLVFAFSAGGDLWTAWSDGTSWHWTAQGTPPGEALDRGAVAAVTSAGRPIAFAVTPGGKLWAKGWDGSAWRWSAQGPAGARAVGPGRLAVAVLTGRPHVTTAAADAHLWLNWWDGTAWHWADQGAPAPGLGAPAALTTTTYRGRPYVFVLTSTGDLWANWWTGTSWTWTHQSLLAGLALGAGALTAVTHEGRPLVSTVAADGRLSTTWWDGRAWRWTSHGAPPGPPLAPSALAATSVP